MGLIKPARLIFTAVLSLIVVMACNDPAPAGNRHGSAGVAAPGAINDLTTPTATGTSFLANFSTPTGTITSYEYRINGGTATPLGGGSGTAITNQTTGLAVSVEVRAVGPGGNGPWSNVSTGDPGITLDCKFDNNDPNNGIGEANGSWQDTPTGVTTTSGSKDFPDVGFPGTAGHTAADATANMLQWCSNVRYFVNSTAKIKIVFGMGRGRSALTPTNFNWIKNGSTCNCVALNYIAPFSGSLISITYAQYRALVAQLPTAAQRALFPDPGSFPGGGTPNIGVIQKAFIEQTDVRAFEYWTVFEANSFTYDWNQNPEVNGSQQKGSYLAWHEFQQAGAFAASSSAWNNWLIFKGVGQVWAGGDPESPKYASVDNGSTSLGNVSPASAEPFDLIAGQTGMPTARQNANPGNGATGMPSGTPMTAPAGTFPKLPFRLTQDAPQFFMIWPASPWLQSQAGF